MTLPEVTQHTVTLNLTLRKFLFLRHLRATLEFDNGIVIGAAYG